MGLEGPDNGEDEPLHELVDWGDSILDFGEVEDVPVPTGRVSGMESEPEFDIIDMMMNEG